jgi:hypothetical protein
MDALAGTSAESAAHRVRPKRTRGGKTPGKSSAKSKTSARTALRAWIAAGIVGALVGGLCFVILRAHNSVNASVTAGDFQRSLHDARDLIAGRDPYARPPGPYAIPYPLPAALVAMPFAWMPDAMAGGAFFGLSVMLLVFAILRSGQEWRIAMLLSWSFTYTLLWVQWTPLICALWFLPAAAAMVLIKPNIALPALLTGEFSSALLERRQWKWLIPPAFLLLVSLVWYPTWPLVWQRQLATYQGISPPLFALPLGPVVLLSLLAWRDRRAWLIVGLALMPQRMVYDQLPLLLVANTRLQLWILIAASWVNCALFLRADSWGDVPLGWQNFLLATLYLPAVAVVVWPRLKELKALSGRSGRGGHRENRSAHPKRGDLFADPH